MCRIKPVILVSELVDIDDPNMLDRIDNKDSSNYKTCICDSPSQLSCNYCLSNKKEPKSIESSINTKSKILIILDMDYTPIRLIPAFNTPANFKYDNYHQTSDGKINNTK